MTIVIDDRIAQHAIEPADRGFAHGVELVHAAHERILENLLRRGAVADALLDECQEVAVIRDQRRGDVVNRCRLFWCFGRHASRHSTA